MAEIIFNDMEISAIGEVSNITLGNACTSLGILAHNEIDLSIPHVEVKTKGDIVGTYKDNQVVTRVNYVKGLQGSSILFFEQDDVKKITDLMMGSDGYGMFYQQDFSEMHLSAVSEVMNQMMGSAATAMGLMLDRVVDISTPETMICDTGKYIQGEFPNDSKFLEITFDLKIGTVISTQMVLLYPYVLGKAIADLFLLRRAEGKDGLIN